ncbi:hypothetical protein [Delftia tsuruhatensis]|uniref:hypothetical protein n=1 Tax=Delftia tsuruhatensis TaxID=180282 RepID=UPI001F231B91|nr:hypothetical protein [Delftia tsuruhatensis]
MKEFAPGTLVDGGISKRLLKFLVFKFFKNGIVKKKYFNNGKLKEKKDFSFKRPFSFDKGLIISTNSFNDILLDDEYYVLRHYKYNGDADPVFCVSKKELIDVINNITAFFNYEYSYIWCKDFKWCIFVMDGFRYRSDGSEEVALKIYYPLST